jgi:hypothetical protein
MVDTEDNSDRLAIFLARDDNVHLLSFSDVVADLENACGRFEVGSAHGKTLSSHYLLFVLLQHGSR